MFFSLFFFVFATVAAKAMTTTTVAAYLSIKYRVFVMRTMCRKYSRYFLLIHFGRSHVLKLLNICITFFYICPFLRLSSKSRRSRKLIFFVLFVFFSCSCILSTKNIHHIEWGKCFFFLLSTNRSFQQKKKMKYV